MTVTMKQKLTKAKKRKKGFTLVELVIVIAILAILAAIAIPVITTTINSSKMSVMESDAATLNMLIKEAVNVSKIKMKGVYYNGAAPANATIEDVLIANNIVADDDFFTRDIGGKEYKMVFTKNIGVEVSGGSKIPTSDVISDVTPETMIKDLEEKLENGD